MNEWEKLRLQVRPSLGDDAANSIDIGLLGAIGTVLDSHERADLFKQYLRYSGIHNHGA